MAESAKNSAAPGLRARKREATRSAITTTARLFTARHGLNGFTIEQVCEEVGVSRRTFFNYFPSKEDAIVGHLLDDFPAVAMAAFLAGGQGAAGVERGPSGLTTTLLPALFELTCAATEQLDFTKDHIHDLVAAIKAEPQLLLKMMGSAETREREFAGVIAQREDLPPDHEMTLVAASVFGTLSRRASQAFFAEGNTLTYRDILAGNLRAAQQIFISTHSTFEGTR
ncbi:TetR/AcrR family transcriptional regulator [Specibacter sp. RAF43]|uniref:TetR/AcrR family transcriptional regulator n=1 Tax=Specibacter sp. RAF43 TaxID=3233057 RepID=UPI003F99959E